VQDVAGCGRDRADVNTVSFWNRLSTRLTALILVVVAVLAGAAIALLGRGFSLAQQGLVLMADGSTPADLDAIIRGTVINLTAVFLFTLVAATIFSRSLLTEPIASLAVGTRELAEGNLGVTLPATSNSELGELARSFNLMSLRLAERTRELTDSNEALKASEQRYAEALERTEQHVQERTVELTALLELSNSTAVTLELHPLLERILVRLDEAVPLAGAAVLELNASGELHLLVQRGSMGSRLLAGVTASHRELTEPFNEVVTELGVACLALPLVVRDRNLGLLVLTRSVTEPFRADQLRIASAFANQVAVALENANLYEQVHEQAAFEERQHLARELHESVFQALYGILLGEHTARKQLHDAPEKAGEALSYVENLAQAGLAEMRALIFELRPESLEKEGLTGALKKQLDALESRHELETEAELAAEPDLPLATKQVLFRIAQEAMHNIVKHARARHVHLRFKADSSMIMLSVRDDGQGFDPAGSFPGQLGLSSMRERTAALGGVLTLSSTPGGGTEVLVKIPAVPPEGSAASGEKPWRSS
jgi:signal transduction histidine kinase